MLWFSPKNIDIRLKETKMPECMPDHCKTDSVPESYRKYYREEKKSFAKWTNREVPEWFVGT
jgi:hypothetical protein